MTTSERIKKAEEELNLCVQQVNEWRARQLRAEGALVMLRQIAQDETQINANPPADDKATP